MHFNRKKLFFGEFAALMIGTHCAWSRSMLDRLSREQLRTRGGQMAVGGGSLFESGRACVLVSLRLNSKTAMSIRPSG